MSVRKLTADDIVWATRTPKPPIHVGAEVRGCFQYRRSKRNRLMLEKRSNVAEVCVRPFGHSGPHRWHYFTVGSWAKSPRSREELLRNKG